ncbi:MULTISPECIES: phosphatidylserine decarboxylase [Bacteroidaceae]|uniref:phosphatidylserine decarboxylase n=1 Tax=Bacteroidaceae TaxID=815 RepID=UPI0031B7FDAD
MILFRQIAGFIARRIVSYIKLGYEAEQNTTAGFIKFGSRVDILLPLEYEILVELGDAVVESQTPLARVR